MGLDLTASYSHPFVGLMTDFSIARDNYNRPLLYPPEGGRRVAYSRPSTLAKDLDKPTDGLYQYYQTKAMIGMAKSKAIEARVKALVAKGGNWENAKGDFKDIITTAEKLGGATEKADRGTALHDYCESVETDSLDWDLVPEEYKGPLDAYYENVVQPGRIKFLAREVFVVVNRPLTLPDGRNITLRVAGSCDRIGELDGERMCIELKTGQDDKYRMAVSAQLALYADGQLYQDAGVRQSVEWAEYWPNADDTAEYAATGASSKEALMLHCSSAPDENGKWRWRIYRVPLARGRQIVMGGQWARKLRTVPMFEEVVL